MYRLPETQQLTFDKFFLPFGGKLRRDNRWVRLADMIPWADFESAYADTLTGSRMGCPALPVRMALGALIIKERLGTSDRETVAQIQENPSLQYFLGFREFRMTRPFDPSLFVQFRKRLGLEFITQVNDRVCALVGVPQASITETSAQSPGASDASDISDTSDTSDASDASRQNRGKLVVDATCAPADIAYPTDLNLLNEAREQAEQIIDTLYDPVRGTIAKPRTYRQKARKAYLRAAKARRLSRAKRRKAVGQQLRFLRRDLRHIEALLAHDEVSLTLLSSRQYRQGLVIQEVLRQQHEMYDLRSCRIDGRIVSLSQPHVRPIVRGKAKAPTEFGAKLSVSVIDGLVFLERLEWENFNESTGLIAQLEDYKARFGVYPVSVHADKIYRTRANRAYCTQRGIRLSGPPLGRPPKPTEENRAEREAQKRLARQDEGDRNIVEGKFGQAKRRFSLGRVMTKLADTSACAITVTLLVVNLSKWLPSHFFVRFCLRGLLAWTTAAHEFVRRVVKEPTSSRFADAVSASLVRSLWSGMAYEKFG